MKFAYKKIGSARERPFVPIKIRNPKTGSSVDCYALVDSGSDCNLFAPILGDIIGVDVERGRERPIGGVVAAQRRTFFEHDLEIVVGGWVFPAKVGFMRELASNTGEGIVGQTGFFDQFKFVKFDKRKGTVELGEFLLSGPR
jgi:hypothetical protein